MIEQLITKTPIKIQIKISGPSLVIILGGRKKSMSQVPRIVGDSTEYSVIGLSTCELECWAWSCMVTWDGSRKLPHVLCLPHVRSITKPTKHETAGNDSGLERELEYYGLEAVLSQRSQGKQSLCISCHQMVNMISKGESSAEGHNQYLYWINSLEASNCQDGIDTSRLLHGATNTISTDFKRFKDKLLAAIHFSPLVMSVVHLSTCTAGIIKYESLAYL